MPIIIKESIDDDSVDIYVQNLQELTNDVLISNELSKFRQLEGKERASYLSDFTKMARKRVVLV